jgi:serine/threonine protein kinase
MALSDTEVVAAFPDFQVVAPELGRGTFKAAYLGEFGGRSVVVKVLLEALDDEIDEFTPDGLPERFGRELDGMATINSRHVVQMLQPPAIRQIGESNHAYYIEPYYAGGTLRERLTEYGPLPEPEVAKLARCLFEGVKDLWQSNRIVHRDIKPGNIVFDEEGHAVLLDLGIALYSELSELTDSSLSSPRTNMYAAPEQFELRRAAMIDFRTDQYLIGMVLHEASCGVHPFWREGISTSDYFAAMDGMGPGSTAHLPLDSQMQSMIARLLAPKPNRRFRTLEEPLMIVEELL